MASSFDSMITSELLQLADRGDKAAQKELWNRLYTMANFVGKERCKRHKLAFHHEKDVIQLTMQRIIAHSIDYMLTVRSMIAWIRQLADWAALDFKRWLFVRGGRDEITEISLQEEIKNDDGKSACLESVLEVDAPKLEDIVIDKMDREVKLKNAYRIIESYGPLDGKIFHLYLEGYRYREIANHVGIAEQDVANCITKIRKSLCKKLAN